VDIHVSAEKSSKSSCSPSYKRLSKSEGERLEGVFEDAGRSDSIVLSMS
jgi:hypothetical protein